MSALRLPGPDGRIQLVPIDDGAVARVYGQSLGLLGRRPAGLELWMDPVA